MKAEVRAAAERLNKLKDAPSPGYGHPYEYQYAAGGWYVDGATVEQDRIRVSGAFLPYLDQSPITEDVLREMGWDEHKALMQFSTWIVPGETRLLYWQRYHEGEWWVDGGPQKPANIVRMPDIHTVGQLRMLLDVLGVTQTKGVDK